MQLRTELLSAMRNCNMNIDFAWLKWKYRCVIAMVFLAININIRGNGVTSQGVTAL